MRKPTSFNLFQTMSDIGNIKQFELYVDGSWGLYGIPTSWSNTTMKSYFIHKCSNFNTYRMAHYYINYENEEGKGTLYDIVCEQCHTSAPQGLQALYRFHSYGIETTLVFLERAI
ncbi:hypothetical protein LCGC14_0208440 [marine sediment metagenome]|uniref:Uncharacterized protein n=1 Tax=marine sediment metagenome TaxID=412755 RepID=A0A0F9XJX1_9ZZZZ